MIPDKLRYLSLFFLSTISSVLIAGCANVNPPDPFIPTKAYVLKDLEYGMSYDTAGQLQHLTLDVYFPAKTSADQKFPLFVMLHAGSYQVGTKEWQEAQCKIMADYGFIAASINYRLGWRNKNGCKGSILTLAEAEYRGMQDANASLRFLVSKAEQFGIDTSWIFIGGESAGAAIALNSSYISDATVKISRPEIFNMLGSLFTSGNKLNDTFTIKGICSKFGAISDSSLITSSNAIPAICFHGSDDPVVPFDKGYFLGCKNTPAFGSMCIYRQLEAAKTPCEIYIRQGGAHMPPEFSPKYTMSKVAVFFRQIMRGKAKSGIFIE